MAVDNEQWLKAEAEYKQMVDKMRQPTQGWKRGGPEAVKRAADLFEGYPHDYDLANNPLTEIGSRLLGKKLEVSNQIPTPDPTK